MKTEIGKRIEKVRIDAGMTKKDFAKIMGYSSSTFLIKIESGESSLTVEKAVMIHEKFGVSLDYLILGKETNQDEVLAKFNEIQNVIGDLNIQQMRIVCEIAHNIMAFCNSGDVNDLFLNAIFYSHKERIKS